MRVHKNHLMLVVALSLLLSGFSVSLEAGQGHRVSRDRDRVEKEYQDTGALASPGPVADDSPIDPDATVDKKTGRENSPDRESSNEPQKKRSPRKNR